MAAKKENVLKKQAKVKSRPSAGRMSVLGYAKTLMVDEKLVRLAITSGRIVKGYDKKNKTINKSVADEEWGFQHKQVKSKGGQSKAQMEAKLKLMTSEKRILDGATAPPEGADTEHEYSDYSVEELLSMVKVAPDLNFETRLRYKEVLGVVKQKLELEEMHGLLVRKSDVDKALFTAGVEFKKALMAVIVRVSAVLVAAENEKEVEEALTKEFEYVLTYIPNEIKL